MDYLKKVFITLFLLDYILKARKRLLKSPKYLAVLLFLVTFAVGYINK